MHGTDHVEENCIGGERRLDVLEAGGARHQEVCMKSDKVERIEDEVM